MELRTRIVLRWRDMDTLGHLNQAVYHELLEEGRGALLLSLAQEETEHWSWVVARVELDYRAEVRKDHEWVDVVVRVEQVGTKSVTVAHDVERPDGVVAASGRTVMVGWDSQARGARTLTDRERTALTG